MESNIEKKSILNLLKSLNTITKNKYILNIDIIGPIIIYITEEKIYSFSFIGAYSFSRNNNLFFNQIPGIIFQNIANDFTSMVKDEDLMIDYKNINRAVKYFKNFFKRDDNLYLNYKRELFWNTGNFNNVNILNDIRFVKNFILENKNILSFNKINENIKLIKNETILLFKNDNRNIEVDIYYEHDKIKLGEEVNFTFHRKRAEYNLVEKEFNLQKLRNIFYDYFYEETDFYLQINKFYEKNRDIFSKYENLEEEYENRFNLFFYIANFLNLILKLKNIFIEGNKSAYKNFLNDLREEDMKKYIEEFFMKFIILKNEFIAIYEIILSYYFPREYRMENDINGTLLIIYHRFTRIKIFLEDILKYYRTDSLFEFMINFKEELLAIFKKSEEHKILFFSEEIREFFKINHNIIFVDKMWCTFKQYNITIVLFLSHLFIFYDRNNIEFKNSTLENFKIIDYNRLENTKMVEEDGNIIIEIFSKNNNNNIYLNKQVAFENIIYRQYRFKKINNHSILRKFYFFKGKRQQKKFHQTIHKNFIFNHCTKNSYREEFLRLNSYVILVDCNIKYLEERIKETLADDLIIDRSIFLIYLSRKNKTLKYYSSKNLKLKPDIFTSENEIYTLIYDKIIEHRYAFPLLQFDYIKYMNSLYVFNKRNEFHSLEFTSDYFFGLGYLNNARKIMLFIEEEIIRFKVENLYSDNISIKKYNKIISYQYEQRKNYKNHSLYDLTATVNIFLKKSLFEIYLNHTEKNQYISHFIKHFKKILKINQNIKIDHLLSLIDYK